MSDLVTVSRDGNVGVITLNNPPVNALSQALTRAVHTAVQAFSADANVVAVVLIGGGKLFSGGADIAEFGEMVAGKKTLDGFPLMLDALENCSKPVVAAIHGTAFGGGLETAMACHYRVAAPGALVGQPEVNLGLIPGAGGTQRLPRLTGVAKAAVMCAVGKPIDAAEALSCGVIDRIIEGELLAGAVAFAREVAASGPRRTCDLTAKIGTPATNAAILNTVRAEVAKKSRGLLAPLKAVEAVEAAATLPFAEGIKKEAELFRECLFSDQSKALIHVFFAEREVAKVPGIGKDTPRIPIRRAAVVGAGTMGGGIAMTYANAGIPVLLREVNQEAGERGRAIDRKN
jgi:3-hydroxyacyl-CoA dehydrogenase